MAEGGQGVKISVEIDAEVWAEEVERLRLRSPARVQAEKARRRIEADARACHGSPAKKKARMERGWRSA
jgi:hypothetical protein